MTKQNLAFIGLGVMGGPMAGHLADAGYQVAVFNRTARKAQPWLAKHANLSQAATPALAVQNAQVVFMCVGADKDISEVITGADGVLTTLKAGGIIVDHTTASASIAQEMAAACQAVGVTYLDAPVSGGEQGAINGQLTIMVGGDASAFTQTEPLMQHFARAVTYMGASGAGQTTKMVNQICIAGLVQGLAEGLNFAQAAGLDATKVVDVISQGAASSWQMQNRSTTMLADEYNHGFAVDWMRKDLHICLEEARKLQVQLPVTALVDNFYAEVQQMGGGRWDTSSLLKRLQAFKIQL